MNQQKEITSIEKKYKMDFEWTKESLQKAINNLELYQKYESEGSELNSVFGYRFAYAKMNGIDPKKIK